MPGTAKNSTMVRCSCGSVELECIGAPITSVVCYCDDCQEGSRQIEALPNARPAQDPDGGPDTLSIAEIASDPQGGFAPEGL
jgi:hypothetical protein